jgi:hypothetical protein
MPVEEIILTLPESARESELRPSFASEDGGSTLRDELIACYRQMLEARRRLAWTRRSRARREEVFDIACKGIAKQLARQSADAIDDRTTRFAVRALIYGGVDGLLSTAAREERRQTLRNRRVACCAFLLGSLGALMVIGFGGCIVLR